MGKEHSKMSVGQQSIVFDPSLIDSLPQASKDVIIQKYEYMKGCIDDVTTKCEQLKVNSEQKIFELEHQLIANSEKLQSDGKSNIELRQQLADMELKYNQASFKVRDYQENDFKKDNDVHIMQSRLQQVEGEKEELALLLERKKKEIDRLNEEWTSMSQKVNEANKARVEALAQIDETNTQEATAMHREQRAQQEKEQFQRKNEWLENELKDRVNELLALKRNQSSHMLDIQSSLDMKTDEVARLEEKNSTMKKANEELTSRMEEYIAKLKESRDLQTQGEEIYRNELHAQEKLANLYKDSSTEAEGKVQELMKAMEETQKLLKLGKEANDAVNKLRQEDCDRYLTNLKDLEKSNEAMEKELKHANELLATSKKRGISALSDDDIEKLSPAAAATSRLVKSGLSLTQIYSEWVETSEALHLEKEANTQLNEYLDQILKEIEEKAPIMVRQREEYESAMVSINKLTEQMDTARLECENLRVQSDEDSRRCNALTRENERHQKQSSDLGRQVCILLKELEEARGKVVSLSDMDADVDSEVSSSSQLISEKLVTFRGIEEMQEQNQRLLEVVRELSEDKEREDRLATDSRTSYLKEKLETALSEIDMMKEDRERQKDLMESLVQQREMFRAMSSQMDTSQMTSPQATPPAAASQASPQLTRASPAKQAEDSQALAALREAKDNLQQDFDTYRRDKSENEKIINEQVDKFRQEASELRVTAAKLSSQLEYANERFKIQESNVEGYKKEIALYRDKNQKMATSVLKHEQAINALRTELMSTQTNLSHAEARLSSVTQERDLLKTVETRLVQERESLMRERKTQNLVTANLQAIQHNLERSEFEMKTRLYQQIENVEKENAGLKRKLEGVDSQHRGHMATQQRQMNAMMTQKDFEAQRKEKLQAELLQVKAELNHVRLELSKAQSKLASGEHYGGSSGSPISVHVSGPGAATPRPSAPMFGGPPRFGAPGVIPQRHPVPAGMMQRPPPELLEKIKDLQMQLSQANNRAKGLEEQLSRSRQHEQTYKKQAEASETTIQDLNQSSKQYRELKEAELKQALLLKANLESQMVSLEKEKAKLTQENSRLTEVTHKSGADLRRQLNTLQAELQDAVSRREEAIKNEALARKDAQEQNRLSQETQDKYERELILHAADVESLNSIKEQMESFNSKLFKADEIATKAREELNILKATQGETEQNYKSEMKKLQSRIVDLQKQNEILHEEIETLTHQMTKLKQSEDRDTQLTSELAQKVSEVESESSPDQLLQVIRFLRKEKEIAEARLDVVQAEATRYKQQAELLERQVDQGNQALAEERERSQVNVHSAAQHSELMRKVEMLNLLSDSNKLLREEHDRIQHQLSEVEGKAKHLEGSIGPLQSKNRDLQSANETLQDERSALQAEMERWKSRTNHLIEQCNKTDPEEMKRLIQEREDLRKKIIGSTEEIRKLKLANSNLTTVCNQVRNELTSSKERVEKLSVETEAQRKDISAKAADLEEKLKTVMQLRKVGRKYRQQAEEATKQLDQFKEQQASNLTQQQLNAAQGELKLCKEALQTKEEELRVATGELSATKQQMQQLKLEQQRLKDDLQKGSNEVQQKQSEISLKIAQLDAMKQKMTSLEQSMKKLQDDDAVVSEKLGMAEAEKNQANQQITKLTTQIKAATEATKKDQEELVRMRDEETKMRTLMQNAKTKLMSQKESLEKMSQEKTQLKERNDKLTAELGESAVRLNAIKSQLEGRISGLQAELEDARKGPTASQGELQEELSRLQKENLELQQRVSLLQKQLESQKPVPSGSRPTVTAAPVERTSTEARTANIRPMSTPTAPVQPVRGTSAETRARASVRPMAVSPAQTPTATVMPTTMSIPEGESSASPAVNLPSQGTTPSRPTQQVQPVSPRIEEPQVEEISAVEQPTPEQAHPSIHGDPVHSGIHSEQAAVAPVAPQVITHSTPVASVAAIPASTPPALHVSAQESQGVTPSQAVAPMPAAVTTPVAPVVATSQASVMAASQASVMATSQAPVVSASQAPVVATSQASVMAVSQASVMAASQASVMATSQAPVVSASLAPVVAASQTPVVAASQAPVVAASQAPVVVVAASQAPVVAASQAPVVAPSQASVMPSPGSSQAAAMGSQQTQKRPREETDSEESAEAVKRSKMQEAEEASQESEQTQFQEWEIAISEPEEEEPQATVRVANPELDVHDSEGWQVWSSDLASLEPAPGVDIEEPPEQEGEAMQEEATEEVEVSQEEMADEPVDVQEEDVGEEDVMIADDDMEGDDDVIVLEEQDEEETEAQVVEEEPSPATTQATAPQPAAQEAIVAPQAPLMMQRQRTLPSMGGTRGPFAPLPLPQPSGFEEGDDSIVPSTPILSVPRHNDGFAEAVSSPQVPHGRFLFTSTSESSLAQSEFGQLESQGALGMDDTRMDLSQLEEGSSSSGRGLFPVASSRAPPTIAITEPLADVEPQSVTTEAAQVPGHPAFTETSTSPSDMGIDLSEDPQEEAEVMEEELEEQLLHTMPTAEATSLTEETGSSDSTPTAGEGEGASEESLAEKTDQSGQKPKIQKITWDGSPTSDPPAPQLVGTVPRRPRGTARRGVPMRTASATQGRASPSPQQMGLPARPMTVPRGGMQQRLGNVPPQQQQQQQHMRGAVSRGRGWGRGMQQRQPPF